MRCPKCNHRMVLECEFPIVELPNGTKYYNWVCPNCGHECLGRGEEDDESS